MGAIDIQLDFPGSTVRADVENITYPKWNHQGYVLPDIINGAFVKAERNGL